MDRPDRQKLGQGRFALLAEEALLLPAERPLRTAIHVLAMSSSLPIYIAKRILQLVPIVLLIILMTYVLLRLTPGDLADVIAGESGSATAEYMQELRQQFSLDLPATTIFDNYVSSLLQLDLGFSFRQSMPVSEIGSAWCGARV